MLVKVRFPEPDPQLVGELGWRTWFANIVLSWQMRSPLLVLKIYTDNFTRRIEERSNHVQLMHLLSANSKLSCCTSCMSHTRPNTTTIFIIKPTKSRRSRLKKIASGQKCLTASSQNRGLPLISECWFCRAEPFCLLVKMLRAWVAARIAGVIDCGGLLYWGHTIAKELPRHRISTAISRGSLACLLPVLNWKNSN